MSVYRSRILHQPVCPLGTCGICGYRGHLPAWDLTLDRPLCSPCVEPTLQAENALVAAGMAHPARDLTIWNP